MQVGVYVAYSSVALELDYRVLQEGLPRIVVELLWWFELSL